MKILPLAGEGYQAVIRHDLGFDAVEQGRHSGLLTWR
jgi:hypothetical protein